MKAVVYNGPWDMTVQELPKPEPKEGEVLIQLEAVGICGSDLHGFTGESGRRTPGMVMGHEAVGTVVAHGTGVAEPKIGRRVTLFNILADEPPTPEEGDPSFLDKKVVGVNLGTCGAMATHLAIPATNAIQVPEGLAPEIAILAEPIGVATHGFNRLKAKRITLSTIAIMGAGTIGLSALLVARENAADKIAILDILPEKLERIPAFGGTPVLVDEEGSAEEIGEKVQAVLGEKPKLVVDAVGTKASFEQCIATVAEGGTILLIGNLAKDVTLPLQTTVSNETTLIGTYGFDKSAFEEALLMVPKMQEPLGTFIEGRCRLEETPEVMTRLSTGEQKALKVIIEF